MNPIKEPRGLNALLAFVIEQPGDWKRVDGGIEITSDAYDRWAIAHQEEPSIVVGEVVGDGPDRITRLATRPKSELG